MTLILSAVGEPPASSGDGAPLPVAGAAQPVERYHRRGQQDASGGAGGGTAMTGTLSYL